LAGSVLDGSANPTHKKDRGTCLLGHCLPNPTLLGSNQMIGPTQPNIFNNNIIIIKNKKIKNSEGHFKNIYDFFAYFSNKLTL